MVIMIGEQQTKQSSVYFCSLIEASITIVIRSPQFGQTISYLEKTGQKDSEE